MQVNGVIQPPGNGSSSVAERDRAESRGASAQAPVAPSAISERPVTQVPSAEELADDNLIDVNQARAVFEREMGSPERRQSGDSLASAAEAAEVAASVTGQVQADAGQALRAQASRTPSDAAELLRQA